MAKPGANIRDVNLLEKLNERIEASGEAMANIDVNVSNYLNGVRDTLESQLDSIQDKLDEAEQRLSEAESALSACHASQVVIPETGIVTPSCEWEESAVESARMEVEKWRVRYEQGQQIAGECQREISEYNSQGGGHGLILTMSGQHTTKASQLLRSCIDNLQEILNTNMIASNNTGMDVTTEGLDRPLSNGNHANALKDFFNL